MAKSLSILACAALTAIALTGTAHANILRENIRPLTSQCLMTVAKRYEIHPDVLLALLMVEGGSVGENSRSNQNGSYDIGLFQLNTIHLPALAALSITEDELRNDGCLNAAVAGWHLRRVLTPKVLSEITDDESYLRAIALYHSATPRFNEIYANKLRSAFAYLYKDGQ